MKNWRINLSFLCIVFLGAAIIGRLIYLQIFQRDYYLAMAQGQKNLYSLQTGKRGSIFFAGGQVLATSVKKMDLYASPKDIAKKEETADFIAKNFGLDKDLIISILKKDTVSEFIKSGLSEEEQNLVENSNLSGLSLKRTMLRKYPQNEMASQVVGFLGGEGEGQYGIEGFYNDILSPKNYFSDTERDFSADSADGADIYLTLDYNIQREAEKILADAEKKFKFKKGLIIVEDPGTGKILALANYPGFDPNNYSQIQDYEIFQNSAIQQFYEPGSVFKAVTVASALNENKITPDTTYVDTGLLRIGGSTISNFGNAKYGQKTMTQVLEKSINTGAVFAERQVGNGLFLDYVKKFGFFEPTGIDLQGEVFSENKELKNGSEINYATASFGQGIEATPMQMLMAFSIIANSGKMAKPFVVEKIIKNGKTAETEPKISDSQIITAQTAQTLSAMLVNVVERGSAIYAKIKGYDIAGKTGTAQVSYSALGINKKGYSEETWQTFIGFAPAYNPKFAALVKFDNPEAKTSEYSVAPAFGKLADYMINYLQIPPDHE